MFSLPFEEGKLQSEEKIIQIKSSPYSSHVCYLSENSIFITDTKIYGNPILSDQKRNCESISKYGENSWAQWLDFGKLAYGTHYGLVCFVEIGEKGEIKGKKEHHFDFNISSATSYFGILLLANDNAEVVFVSESFEILRTLPIAATKGKLDNKVISYLSYEKGILTGLIDRTPFVYYIKKEDIQHEENPLLYYIEKESSAINLAFNPFRNLYAFSLSTNEIYLMTAGSKSPTYYKIDIKDKKSDATVENSGSFDSEVVYLKFISKDVLFAIYQNGLVVSHNIISSQTLTMKLQEQLQNSICWEVDYYNQQLFFSDYQKLGCFYLAKQTTSWVYTPLRIYDPINNKTLASIGDELPKELYPIRTISSHLGMIACLSNLSGFSLLTMDGGTPYIKQKVNNSCFLDKYLLVFSHELPDKAEEKETKNDELYNVTIYNTDKVKEIITLQIHICPANLQSYKNKLIISSPTTKTYLVFEITNDNGENKSEKEKERENRIRRAERRRNKQNQQPVLDSMNYIQLNKNNWIKIEQYSAAFSILNVCPLNDKDILLHYQDKTTYVSPENLCAQSHVDSINWIEEPSVVGCHVSKDTILIYNRCTFTFDVCSNFFDEYRIITLNAEQTLGQFKYTSKMYIPHMIVFFALNDSIVQELVGFFEGEEILITLLANCYNIALQKGQIDTLLESFTRNLSKKLLSQSFLETCKFLKLNEQQAILKSPKLPWDTIFDFSKTDCSSVTSDILKSLILYSSPKDFHNIIQRTCKTYPKKDEIAYKLIQNNAYIPYYIYVKEFNLESRQTYFTNMKEDYILKSFYLDKKRCENIGNIWEEAAEYFLDISNKFKIPVLKNCINVVKGNKEGEEILKTDKKLKASYLRLLQEIKSQN